MRQWLRIEDIIDEDIVGMDSGNEEDEEDTEDVDENDDSDDDADGDGDDSDDEDTVESLREKLATAEEERDRYFRRMRRADRAKSRADNELKALRDGGSKELADARAEVESLKAKLASLDGTDTKVLIREEFRDFDSVKWHNPKLAFELLDLSEIDVEDGKVDAASLKDAVTKLAKDHPYLVKKSTKDDGDDGDGSEDSVRQPSGARSLNSRKKKQQARTSELKDRYKITGRI